VLELNRLKSSVLLLTVATLASPVLLFARASQPWFVSVGDLPGGSVSSVINAVSADGLCAVGNSASAVGQEAVYWTANSGLVSIGDLPGGLVGGDAMDVSDDGSVIVGQGRIPSNNMAAFRWDQSTGMINIDNVGLGGFFVNGVSGDGSVIVGRVSALSRAFRWTPETGMTWFEDNANHISFDHAYGVSADGSIIVGSGFGGENCGPIGWNSLDGLYCMFSANGGRAEAISPDLRWLVGIAGNGLRSEAFRYDANNGVEYLGDLAGGAFFSHAVAVSDDGQVIVGSSTAGSGTKPFIWTPATGMRRLETVMGGEYCLDLGGWTSIGVTDLSGDGQTVVGTGSYFGNTSGWVAYLPRDYVVRGDLNCSCEVDINDLEPFAQVLLDSESYQAGHPHCDVNRADLNADGLIDGRDIAMFIEMLIE